MDSTAPTNIADYLAQFASAVVPLHDFHVFPDYGDEPNSFKIFLNEGSTFIFSPVDDEGNFGMILYFDDIKIMETPDHHTLLIMYMEEEEATKITATGDDKVLARVEWGV